MNIIATNEIKTVASMEVANMIGKEHAKLLRDIKRYIKQLGEAKIGFSDFFQESTYISEQNKVMPCFTITLKGCEFIAHKLTGQKGTEFTAKYIHRFHELEESSISNSFINALNTMTQSILDMQKSFENRIANIESKLEKPVQIEEKPKYKKPYNPWFAKMQPKYTLLEEYFDITRGQLYKNILKELENIYNIDTQQIQADYCYENNIESCYPFEPYEFNPKYREMIESVVNYNLIKYGIATEDDPITSTRHITIFDAPVKENE